MLPNGSDLNEIKCLLVDIRNLATLFSLLLFNFVRPTANCSAAALAKAALANIVPN